MIRWQWMARGAAFSVVILAIAWLSSTLFAESEIEYPRPCPGGCQPRVGTWGFNPVQWRRWPGTPKQDETNPRAVISEPTATPEGIREQPLPRSIPLQPYQQPMPQPPQGRMQYDSPQMQPLPAEPLSPPAPPKCPAGIPGPQGGTPAEGGTILPPEGGTILPPEGTIVPPAGTVMPATPPEKKGKEPETKPSKPLIEEGEFPGLPDEKPAAKPATPSKNKSSDLLMPVPQEGPKQAAAPATHRSTRGTRDTDWASLAGNKEPKRNAMPTNVYRADSIGTASGSPVDGIQQTGYAAAEPTARADAASQKTVWTVGLNGYCPVELARSGRWVLGDLRWTVVHQGCIYRLAGAAQRQQFLADPDRFAPVNSGNDIVLQVEKNRAVPGQAAHCAIYNNRLYMFSNADTRLEFNKHPERYVAGR
jgi:hypothetical protein